MIYVNNEPVGIHPRTDFSRYYRARLLTILNDYPEAFAVSDRFWLDGSLLIGGLRNEKIERYIGPDGLGGNMYLAN